MHGCICLITPYSYINIYTFFFAEIFDNKFPTSCSLVSKCINIYILRIRTFSTVFLIECTILLSCQPCMGAPVTIFGKSCFSQSFRSLAAPVRVQRYFIAVLISVSLMDRDIEHIFRVFLDTISNEMPLPVFFPLKK